MTSESTPGGRAGDMGQPHDPEAERVRARAQLLPEEQAVGSDAPLEQAEMVLEDSDARTADQEAAPTSFVERRTSEQAADLP